MLSKLNLWIRQLQFPQKNHSEPVFCRKYLHDGFLFRHRMRIVLFSIPNNELVVKWFLLYKSMGDKCSSNCISSKCGMKCGVEFHKTDGNASPHNRQRSCEFEAWIQCPDPAGQEGVTILQSQLLCQVPVWNKTCFCQLWEKSPTFREGHEEKSHMREKQRLGEKKRDQY